MKSNCDFSALGVSSSYAQEPCLFRLGEKLCIDFLSLHPIDVNTATFLKQAASERANP